MDDLSFNWPKKIFKYLIIGVMIVAAVWGVIKWDLKAAVDLYFKLSETITRPMINRAMKTADRIITPILRTVMPNLGLKEGGDI